VARIKPSKQDLYDKAVHMIKCARESTELLMKANEIKHRPADSTVLKEGFPVHMHGGG